MNTDRRKSARDFNTKYDCVRSYIAKKTAIAGAIVHRCNDFGLALVPFPMNSAPARQRGSAARIARRFTADAWRQIGEECWIRLVMIFTWLNRVTIVSNRFIRPSGGRFRRSARLPHTPPRGNRLDVMVSPTRFSLCFEQAVDAIMLVTVTENQEFILNEVNPAWHSLFEEIAASGLGRQPHDVWPTDLADTFVAQFHRCLSSGEPVRFAAKSEKFADRDLLLAVSPVREPDANPPGRITMLFCQVHDNTEQVQLAMRLQHEQRLETVRRLSAGVAHDFNNILQAICGGLELIIDEAGQMPAIAELASIALVSAQRGSHLTQHLLAYARRQVLTPAPVDLREFLPRLRPALEQAIGPANQLELAFFGNHATIFVDEVNLRTALLNLAFNAGRAMPNGGRFRIETSLDAVENPACVQILINDTGDGMDAATLERCHEPFFTTKGATGTGLGLSMVEGFAIQSGGALRLSSRPGHGTSALLTLPACPPPQAPAAISRPTASGGHVLLVDDAADVLVMTGRMLQRAGLKVTTAQSGDAALAELASGHVFDILVTDYAMPGLSGVELIRLAKEMQPGLPGLIITGFHEVDISRLQETAHVLRKPFQRQELLTAIQEQILLVAPEQNG